MVVKAAMVDRTLQQETEAQAAEALAQCRAQPAASAGERLAPLGFVQKGGNPFHVTFENKETELFIMVELDRDQRVEDFTIMRFGEMSLKPE
ncbi:MAG: hypothetical protein QCH35_08885 [Methanomicrobiaceae archaeon]|nr:hypothetical protein [Methanomicrobiaceae archaeon]